MTVTFHALWMVCVLGLVVFAAVAARSALQLGFLVVGWGAAVALTVSGRVPAPEVVGGLAATGALLYLFRPQYAWVAAGCGGVLAGIAAITLTAMGAPRAMSGVSTVVVLASTVWLVRRRSGFAPEAMRDEALLLMLVLGLVVATLPGVLDGWQAAANLNVPGEAVADRVVPGWTLMVLGTSTALGGMYSAWSRR